MARGISQATLREVCSRYPESWQPREIVSQDRGRGFQSQVWRVSADAGNAALRMWPSHLDAAHLQSIHEILRVGRAEGLHELPVLLPTIDGKSFTSQGNHLWELAHWIGGAPAMEVSLSKTMQLTLVQTLARWHQTLCSTQWIRSLRGVASDEEWRIFKAKRTGPSRGWIRRREEWLRLRVGAVRHLKVSQDIHELARRSHRLFERFSPWMDAVFAQEPPQVPYVICHGDFHVGNLLMDGDQVSGIVDFEAVCLDSAARDIARLLGSLSSQSCFHWQESIACYDDIRHLTTRERSLISELDLSGTLIASLRWWEWLASDGEPSPGAEVGYQRWRSIVDRLEQIDNEPLLSEE